MPGTDRTALETLAKFITSAEPPASSRTVAAGAVLDTIGVALAGSVEPSARAVQRTFAPSHLGTLGPCPIWGTNARVPAPDAALANGTAAHALDYDDMCFVSLAHPSAPLVPAAIAAAELAGRSGAALLDATSSVSRFRRRSGVS
jgi:2-methylcitrate dehydratase PrpD